VVEWPARFNRDAKRELLSTEEARLALQSTTDEIRRAALDQLLSMVEPVNGWKKYGAKFLDRIRPLELGQQNCAQ
jgi:hypothetical protein